jgi:hypothetical protein
MILPFLIAWLASRINRHQAHVIHYLREENRILKAKLKGKGIALTDTERRRLAVLAHPIERQHLKAISTIATPDTLQRWYRRLVVQSPGRTPQGKPLGRPRVVAEIEQLVVRMAHENSRWGYRRIQGALSNLGHHIDPTTVRNILRRNHMDPAPIRGKAGMSWSQFVKIHLEGLQATGFFATPRSMGERLWTVMILLGQTLSAYGVLLSRLIRGCTMAVLALVVQQGQELWSRWLSDRGVQCRFIFSRRQRVNDRSEPSMSLASSPRIVDQPHLRLIEQQRSPPAGARHLECRSSQPDHPIGRGVSTSHQVIVSKVEDSRNPVSASSPCMASCADAYPSAA